MRKVEDDVMSPATSNMYIEWVCSEILNLNKDEYNDLLYLIRTLNEIEFTYSVPLDENRAADGLNLRSDYCYETGKYLDKSSGLLPNCTVFEMMAALAYKCESSIMYNYRNGLHPERWFFIMLNNLGIRECTVHNWDSKTSDYIYNCVHKMLHRQYKKNGEGGLFVIKNPKIDQREVDIWKQMNAFLNEFND